MFANLIEKTMVVMDDMMVKSLKNINHVMSLKKMFKILREYKMKLNSMKCASWLVSRKFLGFIINHRRIKANQMKVQAIVDL